MPNWYDNALLAGAPLLGAATDLSNKIKQGPVWKDYVSPALDWMAEQQEAPPVEYSIGESLEAIRNKQYWSDMAHMMAQNFDVPNVAGMMLPYSMKMGNKFGTAPFTPLFNKDIAMKAMGKPEEYGGALHNISIKDIPMNQKLIDEMLQYAEDIKAGKIPSTDVKRVGVLGDVWADKPAMAKFLEERSALPINAEGILNMPLEFRASNIGTRAGVNGVYGQNSALMAGKGLPEDKALAYAHPATIAPEYKQDPASFKATMAHEHLHPILEAAGDVVPEFPYGGVVSRKEVSIQSAMENLETAYKQAKLLGKMTGEDPLKTITRISKELDKSKSPLQIQPKIGIGPANEGGVPTWKTSNISDEARESILGPNIRYSHPATELLDRIAFNIYYTRRQMERMAKSPEEYNVMTKRVGELLKSKDPVKAFKKVREEAGGRFNNMSNRELQYFALPTEEAAARGTEYSARLGQEDLNTKYSPFMQPIVYNPKTGKREIDIPEFKPGMLVPDEVSGPMQNVTDIIAGSREGRPHTTGWKYRPIKEPVTNYTPQYDKPVSFLGIGGPLKKGEQWTDRLPIKKAIKENTPNLIGESGSWENATQDWIGGRKAGKIMRELSQYGDGIIINPGHVFAPIENLPMATLPHAVKSKYDDDAINAFSSFLKSGKENKPIKIVESPPATPLNPRPKEGGILGAIRNMSQEDRDRITKFWEEVEAKKIKSKK